LSASIPPVDAPTTTISRLSTLENRTPHVDSMYQLVFHRGGTLVPRQSHPITIHRSLQYPPDAWGHRSHRGRALIYIENLSCAPSDLAVHPLRPAAFCQKQFP
jgi:hypothetical protein